MQVHRGHGGRAPHIPDLGIRCSYDQVLAPSILLMGKVSHTQWTGGHVALPSSPWSDTDIVK
jgi:hypothetical protein